MKVLTQRGKGRHSWRLNTNEESGLQKSKCKGWDKITKKEMYIERDRKRDIKWPKRETPNTRKTYKCQKPLFTYISSKIKEVLHICTFYLCKTYKCAVHVFTILTKKKNSTQKKLKCRTLQGLSLDSFCSCGRPLGSMVVAFGTFADPF